MIFLKRLILGFAALAFIFLGGSGTQSGSVIAQGGGFIGLIIGVIVLYVFFKMAWRAMGCLPSFIMFFIVVVFILYAIGAFTNGIENMGRNIKSFLGGKETHQVQRNEEFIPLGDMEGSAEENDDDIFSEDELMSAFDEGFGETMGGMRGQPQGQHKSQEGGFGNLISTIAEQAGNAQQSSQQQSNGGFNPANFPAVYGIPKVINGDTIIVANGYLKLYGIDAPEANQTCANKHGRSYKCGQEAALWLKSWITGNQIECRVMKRDQKGNMIGICSLGDYDIGAALVNAGWAVADTKTTDIYAPYEYQAQVNKRGLWQGRFYMPWDWRELQAQKPKIKIIKTKSKKKGILDL